MLDRFKRAIRYRKWAILLFPLTGPIGAMIESIINNNSNNYVTMTIYYFGIAIGVIAYFMAKDEYKELKD
jgi:hypothetical protein